IIVWFMLLKRPVYEGVLVSFIVLLTITHSWGNLGSYINTGLKTSLLYSMVAFVAMSILLTKTKIIDSSIAVILALLGRVTGGAGYVLSGEQYYNADDLYWLSHIIYAEAGNQSLRGQLAVGAVIMNRVAHEGYPDSVYGVVYDRRFGVQFTPTANGTIRQIPSPESVIAAKLVLDGCRISEEALYFLDPDIATSLWVVRNCRALFTIEDHDFYA
ncbi:MAG: cell wall hydrolase, partial [Clostridia bacterium]|nr:cell wall hydrolase [Clostridia bacterium]